MREDPWPLEPGAEAVIGALDEAASELRELARRIDGLRLDFALALERASEAVDNVPQGLDEHAEDTYQRLSEAFHHSNSRSPVGELRLLVGGDDA